MFKLYNSKEIIIQDDDDERSARKKADELGVEEI